MSKESEARRPKRRWWKRWWQFRSSRTGRYVREQEAAANKDTTQSEERNADGG